MVYHNLIIQAAVYNFKITFALFKNIKLFNNYKKYPKIVDKDIKLLYYEYN